MKLNFLSSSNLRRTMGLIAASFALLILGVCITALVSRRYANQGIGQTKTLTGTFLPGLVTLTRLQESTLQLNSITPKPPTESRNGIRARLPRRKKPTCVRTG